MICQKCDGQTSVIDSRPAEMNTIRRRRSCDACGHRFTTWEVRQRPDTRDRSAYFAARYAANRLASGLPRRKPKMPDAEVAKRRTLRKAARAESTATGEPVAAIYERWGVA